MSEHDARDLIGEIEKDHRREDAENLLDLMSRVTGEEPQMWSSDTIGFGQYHYQYDSGQEGEFFKVGFAPRGQNLTIYIMSGLRGFDDILGRLGPHTASKSTVKINHLGDIAEVVLAELVRECVRHSEEVENTMGAIPRMSEIPPRMPA